MGKIILIIFAIMFSPCLLRFLPDPKSRQPLTEEETPEVTFCDAPPVMTEKERKAKFAKEEASSQKQYIDHRLEQIDYLLNLMIDEQEKTIAGSKEWIKFEKEIMRLENQAQALHRKRRKATMILENT